MRPPSSIPSTPSAALFRVQGVSVALEGQPVFHNVGFELPPGKIAALVGPSGAGKSTLLRAIAGLVAPSTGQMTLGDTNLLPLPPEQRQVVLMFQEPLLFPSMNVWENVAFGLKAHKMPEEAIRQKVAWGLAAVQMEDYTERRPQQLSGGQRQRVALARALVVQPRLLLLDEPLASLDPDLRAEMRDLMLALQAQTGQTMLVVTHDPQEALRLADHLLVMMEGQLVQQGPPASVFSAPASPAVARWFGGVEVFDLEAHQNKWHGPWGVVQGVTPPKEDWPQPVQGNRLPAMIRQSELQLVPADNPNGLPQVVLGQVVSSRFMGEHVLLAVKVTDQGPAGAGERQWQVKLAAPTPLPKDVEVGQRVGLHFPPLAVHVFG